MRFAALHKTAAYLIASLGLFLLVESGELSALVVVPLVLAVSASWFVEGEILGRRRWTHAWNAVTLLLLGVQIARATLGGSILTVGIEFAAFLQVNKLFNRRAARDYQQVTVLSLLHLIAATVLETDLTYAVAFLGFLVAVPWALSLGHLRREIEGNYLVDHRSGTGTAQVEVGRILRSRRIVGPGFLLATAALSVPLFLMTAGAFLLFPRVGLGVFTLGGARSGRVAGFSDRIELGGFGVIRDDPTVVLRIELPGLRETPPRHLGWYLRGTAFDRYDGRVWSRTPPAYMLRERGDEFLLRRLHRTGPRADRPVRIYLDPLDPPVVFLPERAVDIHVDPRHTEGRARYRDLVLGGLDEVQYTNPDDVGLAYTVYVAPGDETLPFAALSPAERDRALQLPEISDRVRTLAQRLVPDAGPEPEAAAGAVLRHLRSSYRYTLEMRAGDRAPLDDFLFHVRAGHCEYFSTAMVVLLRAVGVPARNVTGFVGGSFNPYGRYYSIRQGDAHSWVEVYLPHRGWTLYDPTPPAAASAAPRDEGAMSALRQMIDALRLQWIKHVVSYDLGHQVRMFEGVAQWLNGLRRPPRRGIESRDRSARPPTAWLVGIAALIAAVGGLVWWKRRARGDTRTPQQPRGRQARAAHLLLREIDWTFERVGRPRPPAVTPAAHALGLAATRIPAAVARYNSARFGHEPLSAAEMAALRAELRALPTTDSTDSAALAPRPPG